MNYTSLLKVINVRNIIFCVVIFLFVDFYVDEIFHPCRDKMQPWYVKRSFFCMNLNLNPPSLFTPARPLDVRGEVIQYHFLQKQLEFLEWKSE